MDLEEDFVSQRIALAPDREGEVVATLVSSRRNEGAREAVLYLHGFIDYFFQAHLADECHRRGYDFHALDMRKYGRSLLPHQTPNHCESIADYYEEITAALDRVTAAGASAIHLVGHSTGGLVAACYMADGARRGAVASLILNSPFLDMPRSAFATRLTYALARIRRWARRDAALGRGISPVYGESLHRDFHGTWDYRLDWKPIRGFPIRAAWAMAIIDAQRRLARTRIDRPVLLLHSARSLKLEEYGPDAHHADIVLDVADMTRIGPGLGPDVTLAAVEGGLHDLFLSSEPVRADAFARMFDWLAGISRRETAAPAASPASGPSS